MRYDVLNNMCKTKIENIKNIKLSKMIYVELNYGQNISSNLSIIQHKCKFFLYTHINDKINKTLQFNLYHSM